MGDLSNWLAPRRTWEKIEDYPPFGIVIGHPKLAPEGHRIMSAYCDSAVTKEATDMQLPSSFFRRL